MKLLPAPERQVRPEPTTTPLEAAVPPSPPRPSPTTPTPARSPAPPKRAPVTEPLRAISAIEPGLPSALGRLIALIVTLGLGWALAVAVAIWLIVFLISRVA